jgi:hypothetical protein
MRAPPGRPLSAGRTRSCEYRPARIALAFCGLLLLISQCACGGTAPAHLDRPPSPPRLPRNVVAQVGKHSITSAELAHWVKVEAIVTQEYEPSRPLPEWIVPDPPTYAHCIAHLAADIDPRYSRRQGIAALKKRCEAEKANLQRQALSLLITHFWVIEEAIAKRIHLSRREIRQGLNPWARARPGALAAAGVRREDFLLIAAGQARLAKLRRSTLPVYAELRRSTHQETLTEVNRVDLELQKFSDELIKRWRPRTQCRPSYVVPECSESRTALH